jgi:hypothetical protein
MTSKIVQARECIDEVLISCIIDDEAKKLLRKALRLLRRQPRKA